MAWDTQSIRYKVLKEHRDYYIGIKKAFAIAVILYAKKWDEPTHGNVIEPNAHLLIDIRDKFFKHLDNPGREQLLKAVWKIYICEMEYNPWYRHLFGWFIEGIRNSGWIPNDANKPSICWR